MNRIYSKKQRELLRLWQNNKLMRINILEGSVRSGKTWISLVLWAFWITTMPKQGNYLMVAKTLTSLRRNCLDLLTKLVGSRNFSYNLPKKEASLFGRLVYLEGVNDARAESKIRGMTLQGAYCDELTLFTEDFFSMLLSRLSEPGAKLIGTTNPDNPNHWLKTKYIDRAVQDKLDLLTQQFLIDDNIFLEKEYVENLKKEYTGVFYDRFILGLWKPAEGLIYRQFADEPGKYYIERERLPELKYINIGVDFGGNRSQHAFVATGLPDGFDCLYVLRSESIKATGTSVSDIVRLFVQFVQRIEKEYGPVDVVYADNMEQAIINEMRSKTDYDIRNSIKNEIIDRIRCTDVLLSTGRLYLVKGLNDALADGLQNAVWDDKSVTKDKRLDDGTSNIDILDAFEYSFEPYMRDLLEA